MNTRYVFNGDVERYEFCDRVAHLMVDMFGVTEQQAIAKINGFWGNQRFDRAEDDIYKHEPEWFWARVFYYDGHPPGDPREPPRKK